MSRGAVIPAERRGCASHGFTATSSTCGPGRPSARADQSAAAGLSASISRTAGGTASISFGTACDMTPTMTAGMPKLMATGSQAGLATLMMVRLAMLAAVKATAQS